MTNYLLFMMGGLGTRFVASTPKQFYEIDGKPLFIYILEKLSKLEFIKGLVVVVTPSWLDFAEQCINQWNIEKIINVVPGGKSRSQSVFNGLKALIDIAEDNDPVLIHDATHPYVDEEGTRRVTEMVAHYGSATLASMNYDTTYLMDNDNNVINVIPRNQVIAGASPEGFRFKQIYDIYDNTPEAEMESMTSVGAIALAHNIPLKVVPTTVLNLKITYPEDMDLFLLLKNNYYFKP